MPLPTATRSWCWHMPALLPTARWAARRWMCKAWEYAAAATCWKFRSRLRNWITRLTTAPLKRAWRTDMATEKQPATKDTPPPAQNQAPATPSQGGSYTLDDATGEHTLTERTQPKEQP